MLEGINEGYFSPYLIFIKGGFKMNDKEILEHLGLKGYELIIDEQERKKEDFRKRYLFLTEDENWTYIMDDWFCPTMSVETTGYRRAAQVAPSSLYLCGFEPPSACTVNI